MHGISRRELLRGSSVLPLAAVPFSLRRDRRGDGIDFVPPIGACAGLSRAGALAREGGAYIEISCAGNLIPDRPESEFTAKLEQIKNAPVPVRRANGFLPGKLQCTGPDADHEAVLNYAELAFERASRAGIETITFGSSGARTLPEGFPPAEARLQFVATLARMAPLAEKWGVTVAVEPLRRAETNFINRVSEALLLVRAVDHPRVRITADIYHMLVEEDPPESIVQAGAYIHHVHIAEKDGRTAPGVKGDDFRPYLRALSRIGYSGDISIECRWSDFDAQLAPALAALRAQCAEIG